jgi:hypothetical protein
VFVGLDFGNICIQSHLWIAVEVEWILPIVMSFQVGMWYCLLRKVILRFCIDCLPKTTCYKISLFTYSSVIAETYMTSIF